jgi:predicted SAM-dependent methyltransferase
MTVLHISPEQHVRRRILTYKKGIHYIAGDIGTNPHSLHLDITELNLPSNSVDLLYASYVLMMIDDVSAAIQESYRVLRTGGMAILQVPIFLNRTILYSGEDPNIRYIFGVDVLDRFQKVGFEVVVVPYPKLLSAAVKRRYGFEEQPIVVCLKREATAQPSRLRWEDLGKSVLYS